MCFFTQLGRAALRYEYMRRLRRASPDSALALPLSVVLVGLVHLVPGWPERGADRWASLLACEVMLLAPLCLYAFLRTQDAWTRGTSGVFATAALASSLLAFAAGPLNYELSPAVAVSLSYLMVCAAVASALYSGAAAVAWQRATAPLRLLRELW